MSTTLAFLSGKGGSGKTTLALSMSHLLCKCNIRVLLVDCDINTNGATYFYESQLFKKNEKEQYQITSFVDLLNGKKNIDKLMPLKINQYLDFIPSVLKYEVTETFMEVNNFKEQLQTFIKYTQSKYDVVLFDCQAGYTSLLQALLPLMDVDLFVLETDSISGSSMRSLHLKIGRFLGDAHVYQVFNKATEEEFEIYSKIVGTFFTNIGTLLFDWRIRQAFSRSQVPDIDNTSDKYGLDLCDICKIIFSDKDIQKKIQQFSDKLSVIKLEKEREQTEKILLKLQKNLSEYSKNVIISLFPKLLIAIFFIMFIFFDEFFYSKTQVISISIIFIFSFISEVLIEDRTKKINKSEMRKEQWENENKLKLLNKKLNNLNQ